MGFYSRYVLPRLIDLAMRTAATEAERHRWVPLAAGNVLEIGSGSGLNVPFYGPGVKSLAAADPSAELQRLAEPRIARAAVKVHAVQTSAEQLPFRDASFDTVVMTWTLCSIADPVRALREIRRVLRPHGRLLFIEHGEAPDASVRRWQAWIRPWWKRIAGGCYVDRRIADLIAGAGFTFANLEKAYGDGPKVLDYLYKGIAHVTTSK
jgi:ubiquinone/menaquinone biosynthesis C-methylase UbiE